MYRARAGGLRAGRPVSEQKPMLPGVDGGTVMTSDATETGDLDRLHHVAISVDDVASAVQWYRERFRCEIVYQDATWAMLQFANVQMALVVPGQHPPHLGFVTPRASQYGELRTHRDGTRSVYISDVSGNAVELMDPDSVDQNEALPVAN